jgi:hypothetical protein
MSDTVNNYLSKDKKPIEIALRISDTNSAALILLLWEMLEMPEMIRRDMSNLSNPVFYEWLLDEVLAFWDYIYVEEKVSDDKKERITAKIQRLIEGI